MQDKEQEEISESNISQELNATSAADSSSKPKDADEHLMTKTDIILVSKAWKEN